MTEREMGSEGPGGTVQAITDGVTHGDRPRPHLVVGAALLALLSILVTACSAPTAAPSPPRAPYVLPGSGLIGVSWTPSRHPANVDGYTATAQPGGRTCSANRGSAKLCNITGLKDGTTYKVQVVAHGPGGTSKAVSAGSTVAGIPWPAQDVKTVVGDSAVSVSWVAPYTDATNISSYVVTASPGSASCTTFATTCIVKGLTNGTPYRLTVVANNPFGAGLPTQPTPSVTPTISAGASPGVYYLGPLNAAAENTSTTVLQRDAGLSVELPNGRELWIFGDTSAFSSASASSGQFVGGSTAAKGRFVPGKGAGLSDVRPARSSRSAVSSQSGQFLPTPTNTYVPDGSGRACTPANGALYAARWPTGATVMTNTALVLITYTDVCVMAPDRFQVEGWGFTEYQWQGGRTRLGPVDVFPPQSSGAALPERLAFQSPVVLGGKITFYTSECSKLFIGCDSGTVSTTTVIDNPFALVNPASYVSVPTVPVSGSTWNPVNISVAAYPGGEYRIVEQTSIAGSFSVFTATSPTGPWSPLISGFLPGCNLTPTGFCYAFIGHPELSTPTSLLLTYFKPDSEQNPKIGHIVAASAQLPVKQTHPPVTLPAHY